MVLLSAPKYLLNCHPAMPIDANATSNPTAFAHFMTGLPDLLLPQDHTTRWQQVLAIVPTRGPSGNSNLKEAGFGSVTPHAIFNSEDAAANRPELVLHETLVQSVVLSRTLDGVSEGSHSGYLDVMLSDLPSSDVDVTVTQIPGPASVHLTPATLTITPQTYSGGNHLVLRYGACR